MTHLREQIKYERKLVAERLRQAKAALKVGYTYETLVVVLEQAVRHAKALNKATEEERVEKK